VTARPIDGYFFEDFRLGQVFDHAPQRTLTEAEAALYVAFTGARHPLHGSAPLAKAMGHRACPLDDLLVFNAAFGKTVADISYNAIANLGYADVRFGAPVYAGTTLACRSEILGLKRNSNGHSGVVYVRSVARDDGGAEVLSWIRWVMVAARAALAPSKPVVPQLPSEVAAADFKLAGFIKVAPLDARASGSSRLWEQYAPGDVIDHPGGMTIEEADHMSATRLYQNPARVHFEGKRLVYGGHVISVCRALSYDGLENAFAIAAIHGGTHAHPTYGGDTLRCRHVVLAREEIPKRSDVGALRLRMLGVKNAALGEVPAPARGEKHPSIVLDLDYSVLIPRGGS
jgi:2-methylfumaryl-CoA hydratase